MVLRLDEAPNRGDDAKSPVGARTAKEGDTVNVWPSKSPPMMVGPRSRRRQIDVNERRKVVSGTEKIRRREDGIRPRSCSNTKSPHDGGTLHVRIEHGEVWRQVPLRRPLNVFGKTGATRRSSRIELKRALRLSGPVSLIANAMVAFGMRHDRCHTPRESSSCQCLARRRRNRAAARNRSYRKESSASAPGRISRQHV